MATKKVAIIVLLTTLLVAAAAAAAIILSGVLNKDQNNINASNTAIEDLCQNTYYQQTCVDTLSKVSSNTSDRDTKTLITSTFQIAIEDLHNVIKQSASLQEASRDDPATANAYRACGELLDDSITDLHKTIGRTESFVVASDFDIFIDDVKTWLTGALTYQETCLDSFDDVKGDGGDKMRQLLKLSRELTINGLALANEFHRLLMPNQEAGASRRALTDKKPITGQPDFIDYCVDYPDHALCDDVKGYPDGDHKGKAGSSKTNTGRKLLLEAGPGAIKPNVIVAQDGTGKYDTINHALQQVPKKSNETFVIYIKQGVYKEHVMVNSSSWSVMFIGDGPTKTMITGNRSALGEVKYNTSDTATVTIKGDNFIARDIGFENTAGGIMEQAVALRIEADKTIIHNCHMSGYQDTLYAHNHRQFYRDCTISGTVDFIFGNARAVFQNCTILVRKPLKDQKCMVTAQGRTNKNETSGFVIQNSRIMAAPEYPINDGSHKTYLGRPWKEYAVTVVMDSELDRVITPEGWSPWNETTPNVDNCYYAEVHNRGPGADLRGRVKWPGIIKSLTPKEIQGFTPGHYMQIGHWIRGKGIPYHSGPI